MSGPLNPRTVSVDDTVYVKKTCEAMQTFFDKCGLTTLSLKRTYSESVDGRKQSVASCRRAGLQNSLDIAESRIKDLTEQSSLSKNECLRLKNQIELLKSRKSTDTDEFKKLVDEKNHLQAELDAKNKNLQNEKEAFEELVLVAKNLESKEKRAITDLETVRTALEAQTAVCEEMSKELESNKGSKVSLEDDVQILRAELRSKNTEIEDYQIKLAAFKTLGTEVSAKNIEISDLRIQYEHASAKLVALKAEADDLQTSLQNAEAANLASKQRQAELEKELDLGRCNSSQFKKTVQELENELDESRKQLAQKSSELGDMRVGSLKLETEIEALRNEYKKHIQETEEGSKLRDEYYNQCSDLAQQLFREKEKNESIEQQLEEQRDIVKKLVEKQESEHAIHTESKSRLEKEIVDKNYTIAGLEEDRDRLKDELEQVETVESDEDNYDVKEMEALIDSLRQEVASLQSSRDEERQLARSLQNQIHTLKGNIRVVARLRPLVNCSVPKANITLSNHEIRVIESKPNFDGTGRQMAHQYKFDRVFDVQTTNQEVCEETEYLVQSALDGHNVCIFAYGQTGSGKTYTMSSKDGVNTSAMRRVMQAVTDSSNRDSQYIYTAHVVCVEIYNEKIRDLLDHKNEFYTARGFQSPIRSNEELAVISAHNNTSQPLLVGATEMPISTFEQAEAIMEIAVESRKMAATAANSQSSRSHLVFTIKIQRQGKTQALQSPPVLSLLNLVDLAGSERLTHSLATGDRLVETKAINTSLSALGNVINALMLAKIKQHIPFRSSKLTHLLQSSLSGSAKVMVVIALSPEASSIEETKSSLRFADKASKARIGIGS